MKNYREIADSVFARREQYMIAQRKKKQVVARATVSVGSVALVSLAGFALWGNDAFHNAPPVTDGGVTTTTVPTGAETTTDTTAPTATTVTEAPTQTAATTVTPRPSTSHTVKTEPTKTTAPTQTTTTTPKKVVITADVPDDYGAIFSELPPASLNPISPALQSKMVLYNGIDVLYSVIVEIVWTSEESDKINRFPDENAELICLSEEKSAAYEAYIVALQQAEGLYTPEVQEKYDTFMNIENEYMNLCDRLKEEYASSFREQRVNDLYGLSDKNPISLSTDARFFPFFAHDPNYAFFMELTAEKINDLAMRGGYIIRLVYPKGDIEMVVPE